MIQCDGFNIHWITIEDAKRLSVFTNKNKEAFSRYFPMTLSNTVDEATSIVFLNQIFEDRKSKTRYLFSLKTDNQFIGLVYIKEIDWQKKEGEFAYCMDTDYGGQGWMSQAVKTITKLAFSDLGLESLKIVTHKTNTPSVKVAINCGFTFIKTLNNAFTPTGEEPLDMELYVLKKQE